MIFCDFRCILITYYNIFFYLKKKLAKQYLKFGKNTAKYIPKANINRKFMFLIY